MLQPRSSFSRSGRVHWAALAFLIGFMMLLVAAAYFYLLPAMVAYRDAGEEGKNQLRAVSALLLAVILFCLCAGVMLTFRLGRYFMPRPGEPRQRTKYVDAWAESGRRMETPPPEEETDE